MSALIFVEELDRAGKVERRHRVDAARVRIGRGYSNDVILDDAAVAADHLTVELAQDGSLHLAALDDRHPWWQAGGSRTLGVVGQDDVVMVGDTRLRFRTPAYRVAPAARVQRHDWRGRLEGVRVWALLYVLAIVTIGLQAWLEMTGESVVDSVVMPTMIYVVALPAWAGVWALISRVLVRHHHFGQHLAVVSGASLATVVFAEAVVQPLSIVWLPGICYSAVILLICGLWAYAHLRLASHGNRWPMVLVGLGGLALLTFLGLDFYNDMRHFKPRVPADVRVLAISPAWQPKETPEQFFARAAKVPDEADDAAKRME